MKPISCLFLLALLIFSCKKTTQEDLCEGVTCLNGGTCINGDCSCPPGYTGPACEQEKVPVKMRVSSITLTDFPLTNPNGTGWDVFDGPDVFIQIKNKNTDAIVFSSGFVEDLLVPNIFTANMEFTETQATYIIGVFDYDDGLTADDYMGGIQFTPYQAGQKFPTTVTLQCGGCDVSFTLNGITYTH